MKFNVTFETVTPESAVDGDIEDSGFLAESVSLRDALDTIDASGLYCEADSYPTDRPRWFTFFDVTNGTREWFETGTGENRSLHLPDNITSASARRIARLIGAYGF